MAAFEAITEMAAALSEAGSSLSSRNGGGHRRRRRWRWRQNGFARYTRRCAPATSRSRPSCATICCHLPCAAASTAILPAPHRRRCAASYGNEEERETLKMKKSMSGVVKSVKK